MKVKVTMVDVTDKELECTSFDQEQGLLSLRDENNNRVALFAPGAWAAVTVIQ